MVNTRRENHGESSGNNQDVLLQTIEALRETVQALAQNQMATNEAMAAPRQDDLFKKFLNTNPPKFYGNAGAEKAANWLTTLESIYQFVLCSDAQKAQFATMMLREQASAWWTSKKAGLTEAQRTGLTWATFREYFEQMYITPFYKEKFRKEFMTIKQRDYKSVGDFINAFNDKAQFAPTISNSDGAMMTHFLDALEPRMQQSVRFYRPRTFDEVKDAALEVEQGDNQIRGDKRPAEGNNDRDKQPYKKFRHDEKKSGNNNGRCPKCNRYHGNKPCNYTDPLSIGACFKCGKVGHKAKDCRLKKVVCYTCQEEGHISPHCPKRKDGDGSNNPPRATGRA